MITGQRHFISGHRPKSLSQSTRDLFLIYLIVFSLSFVLTLPTLAAEPSSSESGDVSTTDDGTTSFEDVNKANEALIEKLTAEGKFSPEDLQAMIDAGLSPQDIKEKLDSELTKLDGSGDAEKIQELQDRLAELSVFDMDDPDASTTEDSSTSKGESRGHSTRQATRNTTLRPLRSTAMPPPKLEKNEDMCSTVTRNPAWV